MATPKDNDPSTDIKRGQKKPFEFHDAYRLKGLLEQRSNLHYACLFMVAVDSMLRCSDVLQLKVHNVRYISGRMRTELALKQQKSQHNVYPVLSPDTQDMCRRWIQQSGKKQSDYLFTGERFIAKQTPISHTTYRYQTKQWARQLGLDEEDFSTHSLRRTKPYYLFYQCGVCIEEISELLGHRDTRTTRIYVGIDKIKAQQSALKHNLFNQQVQKLSSKPTQKSITQSDLDRLTKQVEQLTSITNQLKPLIHLIPKFESLIDQQNSLWSTHD